MVHFPHREVGTEELGFRVQGVVRPLPWERLDMSVDLVHDVLWKAVRSVGVLASAVGWSQISMRVGPAPSIEVFYLFGTDPQDRGEGFHADSESLLAGFRRF